MDITDVAVSDGSSDPRLRLKIKNDSVYWSLVVNDTGPDLQLNLSLVQVT